MKKAVVLHFLTLALLTLFSTSTTFAQNASKSILEKSETNVKGGLTTLFAVDPLASSICFFDGKDGYTFQQFEVRNRCSHLNFNSYSEGSFTVGIQGSEKGTIIDLGTADDLQKRYGYSETVGKGQGFASIRIENGRLVILQDRKDQTVQDLTEATKLYEQNNKANTAIVEIGHTYLARITNSQNIGIELVIKLMVLEYRPGQSVTIRWERL